MKDDQYDSDSSDERRRQIDVARAKKKAKEQSREVVVDEWVVPISDALALNLSDATQELKSGKTQNIICVGQDIYDRGILSLAYSLRASSATLRGFQLTSSILPHNELTEDGLQILLGELGKLPRLEVLALDHCNITSKGGIALGEYLTSNSSVTDLRVDNNNLDVEGCSALCKALAANTKITNLDLSGNEIRDIGATSVAALLSGGLPVEQLNLSANLLGNVGAIYVFKSLPRHKTLRVLNVADNCLNDESLAYLANIVEFIPALESLDVSGNSFTAIAVSSLLSSLRHARQITHLYINECRMEDDAVVAIADALLKSSTLRSVEVIGNYSSTDSVHELIKAVKMNQNIVSVKVYPEKEKNNLQLVLNGFCKINAQKATGATIVTTPFRISTHDVVQHLKWNEELMLLWLQMTGLTQVAEPFQRAKVGVHDLFSLTNGDLKTMGVEPYETRCELVNRIHTLRMEVEVKIRHERGVGTEHLDEEEALLKQFEIPEKLSHPKKTHVPKGTHSGRQPFEAPPAAPAARRI